VAQKVEVHLIDDLDGGQAADETVEFGVDGVTYEIDLSGEHAAGLREAVSAYVAAARKVSGRQPGRRRRKPQRQAQPQRARVDKEQRQAMREWGRKHGWSIGNRGRIPADLEAAFQERNETGKQETRRGERKLAAVSPAFSSGNTG
jgi:hypothetical protein